MSTDGSEVEIEIINFDENRKSGEADIWKYPGEYAEVGTSVGNVTLGLEPDKSPVRNDP